MKDKDKKNTIITKNQHTYKEERFLRITRKSQDIKYPQRNRRDLTILINSVTGCAVHNSWITVPLIATERNPSVLQREIYINLPLVVLSWLPLPPSPPDAVAELANVSGWISRSMICFNLSVVSFTCCVTSVLVVTASSCAWHRSFNDMGRLSINSFIVSAMKMTEWLF